ncbi:Scr1 family TA system antitoxin-like transcriptional regulator [Actinokineospora iranica]|uniref:Scr1 family TA system antitoxin-like transcriptional regulator n=1 Tax=Actinokineospora iranica TaxID=1271860 RepID=UPI00389903D3
MRVQDFEPRDRARALRRASREQLERLRALADLPHVSFRVVKLDSGAHAALGYPFTLLYIERAKGDHRVYRNPH